jgi:hypothetical protein
MFQEIRRAMSNRFVRNARTRACCSWLVVIGALLAVVLRATPASAQATGSGVLTGTVRDAAEKRPLADVIVTATSPDLQGEQVVITDGAGFFRIPDLPAGVYTVRFEKDGYRAATRERIGLRTDSTLRVNAELLPEVIKAEEVTVEAHAPVIDVGSSSVGQNIDSDFVKRLPLAAPDGKGGANRSFEAVSEVTPGAKGDYNGSGISFGGSSAPENNYLVDGLSVSNPGFGNIGTPLSTEFIKETNVISGGYMPEYGRTMGGVLNAVTKSGSNEYHGGFFAYYSPGALSPPPKEVTQIGGAVGYSPVVSSSKLSYVGDIGADIGGPIIKDKVWFYTGVDVTSTEYISSRYFTREVLDGAGTNVLTDASGNVVSQKVPGSDQSWVASGQGLQAIAKLTWAVNPENRVTGTFIAAPNWSGGAGKLGLDPVFGAPDGVGNGTYGSSAQRYSSDAYDATIKWSSEFDNKRLLLDTTVGYHYEDDEVLPADGSLPGATTGNASMPGVTWYGSSGPNGNHSVSDFENYPALTAACTLSGLPATQVAQLQANGVYNLCPTGNSGYSSGGVGGGGFHRISVNSYYRAAAGSTLTYLLQAAGHHVIKAGFNVEFTEFDHTKSHPGGFGMLEGGQTPLTGANNVGDTEGFGTLVGPDHPIFNEPWRVKPRSIIAGGFIQDSWSVLDVVTLNVGVRYDSQVIYNALGDVGISLPNQWSPRIGMIWDPTQQGRAKVFANYARYYENMPLSIAEASLTGEGLLKASHPAVAADGSIPGTCDVRVPPYCENAAGRSIVSNNTPSQYWLHSGFGQDPVDPDTQPTSVDDFVAGLEYELFKDARFGLTYQRRWVNRWIEDMSADGRATFFIGNPGYGWASIFPKAERQYDAGTLYLQKAFGNDWLVSASYTLSYLRGNIPGLDALGGNHGGYFDAPELAVNAYGPLGGDNSHDIKLYVAKDWNFGPHNALLTGMAARAMSGAPTSYQGGDILYGPGSNYLIPAGTGPRLPWSYDLDATLGYRYSFDKDRSIAIGMDVFNLFNLQPTTGVDTNYTNSVAVGKQGGTLADVHVIANGTVRNLQASDVNTNFGHPTAYGAPTKFRFNIRGTF